MIHSGFYLYDGAGEFGTACADVCRAAGMARHEHPDGTLVAIAPLLKRKLSIQEAELPLYGTLIFHPSILPLHRGPDAIKWSMSRMERLSGVTWFWCDSGLDTGPICEQEPVVVNLKHSPGRNYHSRFVPAGIRSLARAIDGVLRCEPRKVPQEHELGSYEGFFTEPDKYVCGYCGLPATIGSYHEGPEDCATEARMLSGASNNLTLPV